MITITPLSTTNENKKTRELIINCLQNGKPQITPK